jgi:arylsulfatase A-like enzyme
MLFIGDDMGRNDVGYSDSTILTPNFDSMAGSGVKFSAMYSWHWCAPSRGAMMSGRLPPNHGFEHGGDGPEKGFVDALPLAFKLLPEILRDQGYRTIMAGKWHLGYPTPAHTPEGRGFDEYLGYLTGAEDYYMHTKAPVPACPNTRDLWRADSHGGRPENSSTYFPQYSTFIFSDFIVEEIEKSAAEESDKPMFIYASFQGIHSPLEVQTHTVSAIAIAVFFFFACSSLLTPPNTPSLPANFSSSGTQTIFRPVQISGRRQG